MRRASLLAALLLLVLLAAHRAAAGFPVLVYDAKPVEPKDNGQYVSLSAGARSEDDTGLRVLFQM